MKRAHVLTAAMLLAIPLSSLYADDSHHPEKQAQARSAPMDGRKGMGGGMMDEMQARMETMMQQMQEIRKAGDPDERDRLTEKHMQSMHEGMSMMKGMGGGMMAGGDMPTRMDMMEQRMEMMQMMMDQMMQSREQANKTHEMRRKSSTTTKIIK